MLAEGLRSASSVGCVGTEGVPGWVPSTLPAPELPIWGQALQPWTTPGLFPVYKIGVMMPFAPRSFVRG